MMIIEKYYDNGSITVQVDRTMSINKEKSIEEKRCDVYMIPVKCEKSLMTYFNSFKEKYKRLPDVK